MKWWAREKGFGIILSTEGQAFFASHLDIGGKSLIEGSQVTFEVAQNQASRAGRGRKSKTPLRAINIRGPIGPELGRPTGREDGKGQGNMQFTCEFGFRENGKGEAEDGVYVYPWHSPPPPPLQVSPPPPWPPPKQPDAAGSLRLQSDGSFSAGNTLLQSGNTLPRGGNTPAESEWIPTEWEFNEV